MARPLPFTDLPGSERARRFEGAHHGASASFFLNTHAPGEGPDLHRHPYDETFILLEGRVTFTVDGETVEARTGEVVIVPARAPHKFVNAGDARLEMVSIHPPAEMEQEWLEE
jgi:quercetin dioxygenase-like cupin family protein